jgi:hypothetical protein
MVLMMEHTPPRRSSEGLEAKWPARHYPTLKRELKQLTQGQEIPE